MTEIVPSVSPGKIPAPSLLVQEKVMGCVPDVATHTRFTVEPRTTEPGGLISAVTLSVSAYESDYGNIQSIDKCCELRVRVHDISRLWRAEYHIEFAARFAIS